jgi:ubiquinol-cytochrome c reductase cytochrome c1 subunit
MPPPLTSEGQVQYSDGTKPTVNQMAKDVTAFLIWTGEPKMEKRKQTGWPVLGFLLFATILGYLSYRNIWADKKKKV